MNRTRYQALVLLAASLSVTTLAGCPNAGTQPPLNPTTSASPAGSPSGSPSAGATTPATGAPTASPSNGGNSGNPTPVPTLSAPAATGETRPLNGFVYDETGATVDGATVTIRSLDSKFPYSGSFTTANGSYVFNDVPVGVQIEVSATRDGWTRRTRVTSLQQNSENATLHFGGPSTNTDVDVPGRAYFISDFPEVVSATPGASPITGDKLSYKIRFSETMDEDAQELIEDSLSISSTRVTETALVPTGVTSNDIIITHNSTFLDGKRRVALAWNAEGTELTLTFDAPLRTLDNDDKTYTFRLTRITGDDEIEDASGKRLGFSTTGGGSDYFAIKKANLALDNATTPQQRWEQTHQRSTSFDVAEDDTDVKVVSVDTSNVTRTDYGGGEFRQINITFSKPMRVYPDNSGYAASVTNLANYVFAFAEDKSDLDSPDLKDDTNTSYDVLTKTATNFKNEVSDTQDPITFAATNLTTKDANDVFIEPSEDDPRIVSVYVPNAEFPTAVRYVKVLVKPEVTDPAGNRTSETGENTTNNTADNVVIGDF